MNYLLLLLLLPFFLSAQIADIKAPTIPSSVTSKNFSTYTTIGATTYIPTIVKYPNNTNQAIGGDIGIGTRGTQGKHIWDGMIGLQGNRTFQGLYLQSSYLFYPLAPKGPYLGIGCYLAHGHSSYYNPHKTYYWRERHFPFMLGYQFQEGFIQLRMMPIGQVDFCYGFEF